MSLYVPPFGSVRVNVPVGSQVAVFSWGQAQVSRIIVAGTTSFPDRIVPLGQTVGAVQSIFGTFTATTEVLVEANGGFPAYVEVGTSPVVQEARLNFQQQVTPGVLNATGALTWALIGTGIVTSTTAAAVTGTLPTGAVLDASSTFRINDSIDFVVINTGATNTFTVAAAASGHTVIGNMVVALSSSARFRTVKTAAATFVTYRIG